MNGGWPTITPITLLQFNYELCLFAAYLRNKSGNQN